jgi:hypothetical protein
METKMERGIAFLMAFGIAFITSPAFAGTGTAKEHTFCRDCPFPMKISCTQPEQVGGGDNPFPLKCQIEHKTASSPFKTLNCELTGGDAFPYTCTAK